MKKIVTSVSIVVLVLMLALISLGPGGITGAIVADAEVGSDIVTAFNQGKEEVLVIVLLKDDSADLESDEEQKEAIKENQQEVLKDLRLEEEKNLFGFTQEKEFELEYQYETLPAFAGGVTEEGLEKLRNDPQVDKIVVNKERQLFLSGSVPIIKADEVWKVVVNGYNITGEGETVCVMDTGVDYNHAVLASNYAGGYDFYNDDSDPLDDQGHGTHVAGIVASVDSIYRGVAPGAKITAMKVCSSSGSCPDAAVLAGMDWCIANKDVYNISVISISLGGGQYTSYCDEEVDFALYAAAINHAVEKSITVVAATGNSGAGSVAGPACVQNSTRVTATTKSDALPSYASRNAFFADIIAAPGSAITSLNDGGGTITMSGTSMATPHVSGAVALLKQYWKLAYTTVPSPEQLEQKLLASGVQIYDASTNSSFTRIDVLAALRPILTFVGAPQNNSMLNSTMAVVSVSSDVDLSQAWLQWAYPNGTIQNLTLGNTTGNTSTEHIIKLTGLGKGTHSYQAYGSDALGTTGATVLRSFTIDDLAPSVSLLTPSAGANLGSGRYVFSALANDEHSSVSAVFFNLSSDDNAPLLYSAVQNDSNSVWVKEINLSDLVEGVYTVTVYANDSLGNENESQAVLFTLDTTAPNITLLNSSFNTTEMKPSVGFYVIDASSTVECSLLLDGNVSNNSALPTSVNASLTANNTLSPGIYSLQVRCQDVSGNVGLSEMITVTIIADARDIFLKVTLVTPQENSVFKDQGVWFKVTVNSSENISAVTFNFTNASENILLPVLQDNSSGWNAQVNMSTLAEGNHTLTVIAEDVLGTVNNTVSLTFVVDRAGPLLNGITETNVNESSAKIQWATNEAADAKVHYGTSAALGTEKIVSGDNSTAHEVSLFNLAASTLHYYSVTSCDKVDNCNASGVENFTTTAVVVPPPADDSSNDNSSGDDSSSDDSSSGGSSGSSSSGGSGSGGGGSSESSGSSSPSTEELAEAEEANEEAEESVPEETELQIASAEETNQGEKRSEEQQNTETELAAAADNEENAGFGNLLTGFVSAAISGDLNSREYVLVGLTGLVVILTIAFIVIRRRENEL